MRHEWTCSCCGESHDTLPLDYAFKGPDNWFALPEADRTTRTTISADVCIVDDAERYIRGCLEIPLLDHPGQLVFGVWASVSQASFLRIHGLWDADDLAGEPPLFGWLCNHIRIYPRVAAIKCHLHLRPGNLRPRIQLEPTDYPLAVEQRSGVTLARVAEIAAHLGMH